MPNDIDGSTTGTIAFQCNICGAPAQFPRASLGREIPSCCTCSSTPRTRFIIDILARHLLGRSVPLPQFPVQRALRGIGLSDPENYASGLRQKFDYRNTYFHTEPFLDIAGELAEQDLESLDFLISSEVFEHVAPPVSVAFANSFRLLKPGGLLILTVPYGRQTQTLEHFPELHEYSVSHANGEYLLTNRTREGVVQTFNHLVFHGGPGTTLEMRIFAETDLIRHLTSAGFCDIRIHHESVLEYGIYWAEPWSRPISARRTFARQG